MALVCWVDVIELQECGIVFSTLHTPLPHLCLTHLLLMSGNVGAKDVSVEQFFALTEHLKQAMFHMYVDSELSSHLGYPTQQTVFFTI